VSSNCLLCHASHFEGELVVGLAACRAGVFGMHCMGLFG
jgi:hypothetical protein